MTRFFVAKITFLYAARLEINRAKKERNFMCKLKDCEVLESFYEDKKIIQNVKLYRFTSDSILLSKFARAKRDDCVADFCAGCGVVGFHFLCLNPTVVKGLTLVEMQEPLADMARRTAKLNKFECEVITARVQDLGRELDDKFSLILCNPPYERDGFENEVYERAICRKELTVNLKEIVEAAYRKLKFGGRLAIINRADRAAELIFTLKSRGIEPKRLQFVSGAPEAKPYLVMVEGVKGGREGLDVLPALINKK